MAFILPLLGRYVIAQLEMDGVRILSILIVTANELLLPLSKLVRIFLADIQMQLGAVRFFIQEINKKTMIS